MARPTSSKPTEVEMQILAALWRRGPSTVREVHDALSKERDTGYSTTLKMMQVMIEKGLLLKDDQRRPQVYRPTLSEEAAQTQFVDDLVLRVFGGSADKLILRTINSQHVSAHDLDEIKKLISKLEGESK